MNRQISLLRLQNVALKLRTLVSVSIKIFLNITEFPGITGTKQLNMGGIKDMP